MDFIQELLSKNESTTAFLDKKRMENFTDTLFHFLFQLEDKRYYSEQAINIRLNTLKNELISILFSINNNEDRSHRIAHDFFDALPSIFPC